MNRMVHLVKNQKGFASFELIIVLGLMLIVAAVAFNLFTNQGEQLVNAIPTEAERVQGEESVVPMDAFEQLDKDAFVFLGDAGFMTTEEKQVAGDALLAQIEQLLTEAETAETVDMLVGYETKIETELNYGT